MKSAFIELIFVIGIWTFDRCVQFRFYFVFDYVGATEIDQSNFLRILKFDEEVLGSDVAVYYAELVKFTYAFNHLLNVSACELVSLHFAT